MRIMSFNIRCGNVGNETWEDRIGIVSQTMLESEADSIDRPLWPMIILKTPKGWTGPKEVNSKKIEGTFRAHQVPLQIVCGNMYSQGCE